jgi:hypothetical protein
MDLIAIGAAVQEAKEYTDSVALNGVQVKNPQINPATKRWEVFNPSSNSYTDTSIVAEGKDGVTPHIDPETKHWFIGDQDTGIVAEGKSDDSGNQGGGGYQPPQDGIPKKDLSEEVRGLLAKAESALQNADLTAHNTSSSSHEDIRLMARDLDRVKNVEYNAVTGDIRYTYQDNSTLTVNFFAENLAKDLDYDPDTKEIIITKKDDTEVRISIADLVDIYLGSNGAHIQVTVESGNEIHAVLKAGTITETELSAALLAKLAMKEDVETAINEHNEDIAAHGIDEIKNEIKDLKNNQPKLEDGEYSVEVDKDNGAVMRGATKGNFKVDDGGVTMAGTKATISAGETFISTGKLNMNTGGVDMTVGNGLNINGSKVDINVGTTNIKGSEANIATGQTIIGGGTILFDTNDPAVHFNDHRLDRVHDPVQESDGVNKRYVDEKIAEAMAGGRPTGKVFATVAELDAWLLVPENMESLPVPYNFYILDLDVPDYWWDGTQKQISETEKVDLTGYFTKEQINTLLASKLALKLDATATAVDSNKLGGHTPDYFATAEALENLELGEQTNLLPCTNVQVTVNTSPGDYRIYITCDEMQADSGDNTDYLVIYDIATVGARIGAITGDPRYQGQFVFTHGASTPQYSMAAASPPAGATTATLAFRLGVRYVNATPAYKSLELGFFSAVPSGGTSPATGINGIGSGTVVQMFKMVGARGPEGPQGPEGTRTNLIPINYTPNSPSVYLSNPLLTLKWDELTDNTKDWHIAAVFSGVGAPAGGVQYTFTVEFVWKAMYGDNNEIAVPFIITNGTTRGVGTAIVFYEPLDHGLRFRFFANNSNSELQLTSAGTVSSSKISQMVGIRGKDGQAVANSQLTLNGNPSISGSSTSTWSYTKGATAPGDIIYFRGQINGTSGGGSNAVYGFNGTFVAASNSNQYIQATPVILGVDGIISGTSLTGVLSCDQSQQGQIIFRLYHNFSNTSRYSEICWISKGSPGEKGDPGRGVPELPDESGDFILKVTRTNNGTQGQPYWARV